MVFLTQLISIRHFGVRIATEQRAQIVGQHRGVYVYQQRMLSQPPRRIPNGCDV